MVHELIRGKKYGTFDSSIPIFHLDIVEDVVFSRITKYQYSNISMKIILEFSRIEIFRYFSIPIFLLKNWNIGIFQYYNIPIIQGNIGILEFSRIPVFQYFLWKYSDFPIFQYFPGFQHSRIIQDSSIQ